MKKRLMLKLASKIYVSNSKIPNTGKGVFASQNIKKGEVIEIAPILVLEFTDFINTKWNKLFEYYFWMDDYVALALGYGSLYNHSKNPNCKYELNRKEQTIRFSATRDISQDEEILFNYKGKANPKTPLWFEKK